MTLLAKLKYTQALVIHVKNCIRIIFIVECRIIFFLLIFLIPICNDKFDILLLSSLVFYLSNSMRNPSFVILFNMYLVLTIQRYKHKVHGLIFLKQAMNRFFQYLLNCVKKSRILFCFSLLEFFLLFEKKNSQLGFHPFALNRMCNGKYFMKIYVRILYNRQLSKSILLRKMVVMSVLYIYIFFFCNLQLFVC